MHIYPFWRCDSIQAHVIAWEFLGKCGGNLIPCQQKTGMQDMSWTVNLHIRTGETISSVSGGLKTP